MSNAATTLTVEQILDRNSKYPYTPEGLAAKALEEEQNRQQSIVESNSDHYGGIQFVTVGGVETEVGKRTSYYISPDQKKDFQMKKYAERVKFNIYRLSSEELNEELITLQSDAKPESESSDQIPLYQEAIKAGPDGRRLHRILDRNSNYDLTVQEEQHQYWSDRDTLRAINRSNVYQKKQENIILNCIKTQVNKLTPEKLGEELQFLREQVAANSNDPVLQGRILQQIAVYENDPRTQAIEQRKAKAKENLALRANITSNGGRGRSSSSNLNDLFDAEGEDEDEDEEGGSDDKFHGFTRAPSFISNNAVMPAAAAAAAGGSRSSYRGKDRSTHKRNKSQKRKQSRRNQQRSKAARKTRSRK